LGDVEKVLHGIPGIEFTYFDKSDVVRHRLVSDIINAYDKSELEKEKHRVSKYQNNLSESVHQPIIKEQ
jgi:phosphate starvation-inducible protein PhoH